MKLTYPLIGIRKYKANQSDMYASIAGVQTISGVGYKPKMVIITASLHPVGVTPPPTCQVHSFGYQSESGLKGISLSHWGNSINPQINVERCIYVAIDALNYLMAYVSELNDDGFKLTWNSAYPNGDFVCDFIWVALL